MTAPIDKAALARRFLALGPAEQKRFLELLASKGIRFDRLPLVPAPRGEHLPASHAQQRLWLVAQLEPDSSAYHMVGAFALEGELERGALLAALEGVLDGRDAPLAPVPADLREIELLTTALRIGEDLAAQALDGDLGLADAQHEIIRTLGADDRARSVGRREKRRNDAVHRGMIAVMTGRHDVKRITLDDSLMQEDKEVLEDLIAAAVNDAVRKVEQNSQEKMSGMTAGMQLPPGFKMPF